jgi:hypothetical protein
MFKDAKESFPLDPLSFRRWKTVQIRRRIIYELCKQHRSARSKRTLRPPLVERGRIAPIDVVFTG